MDDLWRSDQPLGRVMHYPILKAAGDADRVELRLQEMRQEGRRVEATTGNAKNNLGLVVLQRDFRSVD